MFDLLDVYKEKFSLHTAKFTRIEHEDAIVADVYRVLQPNSEEYILKICSKEHHYQREKYFLTYFSSKLSVPKLIQVLEPSAQVPGALLMECLPGMLLAGPDWTEDLAHEIGVLLGKIHAHKTSGFGDLIYTKDLTSDPKAHFILKFKEGLLECTRHLTKELLEACDVRFQSLLENLDQVDGPCIVHRDFRPGNLIVNQGKLQGIIDWSSARAGFAEEDFYFFGSDEWNAEPLFKKAFLKGYASMRKVPNYRMVMPLLQLSKAIATLGFTIKRGTWKDKDARLYLKHYQLMNASLKIGE